MQGRAVMPRAAGYQPASARQRGALHWSRQLRRRAAGSRAPRLAARRRPAHWLKRRCTRRGSGRRSRAACSLQPLVGSRASPTHLCHCAAATIDGIRAHVGNPTQIILFRMPVSAGSLHEKTVP